MFWLHATGFRLSRLDNSGYDPPTLAGITIRPWCGIVVHFTLILANIPGSLHTRFAASVSASLSLLSRIRFCRTEGLHYTTTTSSSDTPTTRPARHGYRQAMELGGWSEKHGVDDVIIANEVIGILLFGGQMLRIYRT